MFNAEDEPTQAGCWAHARRYLIRAISSHSELARLGIGDCNRLFEFERYLAELKPERRLEERQRIRRPVVQDLDKWLDGRGDSIESGIHLTRRGYVRMGIARPAALMDNDKDPDRLPATVTSTAHDQNPAIR